MTREEEIIEAGIDYTMSVHPMWLGGLALEGDIRRMNRNKTFEEGAKWADSHPIYVQGQTDKMQATEIEFTDWWFANHKEQPTYADALEWMKERMINKACEWLESHVDDYEKHDDECGWYLDSSLLIEDFEKAMEE